MAFWKNLELEWKIVILACLLYFSFDLPIRYFFFNRFTTILHQSVDPEIEPILRNQLNTASADAQKRITASIEWHRQWRVLIPIITQELNRILIASMALFFVVLLVGAIYILRKLTKPLRILASAVGRIGKGEIVPITPVSGGALGILERSVVSMQEELGVLRERMRIAGMAAAWQDIARIMAHEIKNPLTPIRLTLDRIEEKLLLGETLQPQDIEKFVKRINGQIDVLERLVDQFRSFSKEPEMHRQPVDLHKAVQSVSDDLTASIHTENRAAGTVMADPHLLAQVFLNIWKNAIEAGATHITVTASHAGDAVTLLCRDNGQGISDKDIERVWLPYVTTKRNGTGIGLPVIKNIIETMHGSVLMQSETTGPSRGACVVLSLPAAKQGSSNV